MFSVYLYVLGKGRDLAKKIYLCLGLCFSSFKKYCFPYFLSIY